nr:glycosyl hydrolase 53 family protein [uncultured Anaerobutyricum sp.]
MRKIYKSIVAVTLAIGMVMGSSTVPKIPVQAASVLKSEAKEADAIPETSKGALNKYDKIDGISNSTILGADFTNYQQCLGWKKEYKNYMSQPVDDIFAYVKEQGINTISIKVAVNPTGNDEYLSLDNAIKTLKAVEQSKTNLKTNVVLLYSDGITYANEQKLPEGWTEDTAAQKAQEYTKETIAKLQQENVKPDMVTIGNEVNWNFLGIEKDQGWETMGKISDFLTQSGIKSAVSLSAPTKASDIQYIIEKLEAAKVDYSYIGVNLYPDSNTNTYIEELRSEVEKDAPDKQLIVSNVKYDRVNDDDTANVYTQADNIYNLLSATIDKENAGGLIYDNAANAGSYTSLFDDEGDAQISLAIFAYAQTNKEEARPDTSRNPYKYGDDTGLKQQKVTINKVANMTDSTIRGIDISSYVALKNAGVKYYDNNGKEASLLKVLSDNGVNYIRIRIWNDPYNDKGETYGGGSNDVKTGVEIAKEAAKYNIKVLLAFHYSDFWADPALQLLPKAWENDKDDPEKMRNHVYEFTKDTLEQFKAAGAEVGMVQVGNEISQGMMGIMHENQAYVWQEEEKSSIIDSYLNAGARAVRECTPDALIALHLDNLNLSMYKAAMDAWERDNVDYDVFGASSYAFWAGSNMLHNVKEAEKYVGSRGKLFAVLETSWMNSQEDTDGTVNMVNDTNGASYEVGPQGQADMLSDLYTAILSGDNGLGAFYWEGAWIPVKAGGINWEYNKEVADQYGTGWAAKGAVGYYPDSKMYYNGEPAWGADSWDNQTLFDSKGYPLDSLRFYKDAITAAVKQQVTVVNLCDENGNVMDYRYVKVPVGETVTYTLPYISGYEATQRTIEITGEKEGLVKVSANYKVPYKAPVKKTQKITVKKSSYSLPYGSSYDFKKQVSAAGRLTFTSSNSNVISINRITGKMNIKKPGKVTITITAAENASYKAAKKNVVVYAVPKTQTVKKVTKLSGRKIRVTVQKDAKSTGYRVVTATNKSFNKNKKVIMSKNNRQTTLTLKQKKKGTYYVKARSYVKIGKNYYYGPWSKVKKVVLR